MSVISSPPISPAILPRKPVIFIEVTSRLRRPLIFSTIVESPAPKPPMPEVFIVRSTVTSAEAGPAAQATASAAAATETVNHFFVVT